MRRILPIFLFSIFYFLFSGLAFAQSETTCAVYFTGVGCPHCSKTDPVVLQELQGQHPNFFVIEYEIYQQRENAPLLYEYDKVYDSGLGVPLIIFSRDKHLVGDTPILKGIKPFLEAKENRCPLVGGTAVAFEELDISSLPGKLKIWARNRIFIGSEGIIDNILLRKLLTTDDISKALETSKFEVIEPQSVPLSGKSVDFEHAVEISGGVLQWNGLPPPTKVSVGKERAGEIEKRTGGKSREELLKELTLTKVLSLSAVDAINPCALAVLTLMLFAILTYDPKKRTNLLYAGLAFTISVFVMYLFYGLVIIRFFQVIQVLTNIRLWLYKVLGLLAIILGILNLKDFIRYKPGGLGTEMPMFLRPMVQKLFLGLTSPRGAFGVGAFVTVFLLPCTVGPYIICGGILCPLSLLEALPWLLLYNLIFVLPMIGITLACYVGFTTVENVSGWKEKNIRYLHLVAGLIILSLGVAMVLGLV